MNIIHHVRKYAQQLRITLSLTALAILLATLPSSGDLLQWERGPQFLDDGWRVITGHFVHWSANHAFWDILVFAILAAICEQRSRSLLLLLLGVSALLISFGIRVFEPSIDSYRGLSGINTGLFTLVVLILLREKWRANERRWCYIACALLLGLGVKTIFELVTGATLFVQIPTSEFEPLASVHLVGIAVGIATFGIYRIANECLIENNQLKKYAASRLGSLMTALREP